jgi:hypothetical protein
MDLFKWFRPKTDAGAEDGDPAWKSHPDFPRAVDDAMRLLVYAAEMGRNVDDATRNSILHAKAAASAGWDETIAASLLAALTKLTAELSPVTAESLEASSSQLTKPAITTLRWWAFILASLIVPFSVLGFVSSSISSAVRADIKTSNELLVKLRGEIGTGLAPIAGTPEKPFPPGLSEADVITQLQLYASTIRAVDARSRQLNWFVFNAERDPFADLRWDSTESKNQRAANKQKTAAEGNSQQTLTASSNDQPKTDAVGNCPGTAKASSDNEAKLKAMFQLPVGLPNMPCALDNLTTTYQDVRSFAQDVLDLVSVSYGAINTCLLPILYALLGTCAYLLRCLEEELRTLTFTPSSRANWARFLVAGISGAVVGLFGNFSITEGASISPLAIAFLMGYAVDVFFSFLEGLLKSFTKPKNGTASKPAAT